MLYGRFAVLCAFMAAVACSISNLAAAAWNGSLQRSTLATAFQWLQAARSSTFRNSAARLLSGARPRHIRAAAAGWLSALLRPSLHRLVVGGSWYLWACLAVSSAILAVLSYSSWAVRILMLGPEYGWLLHNLVEAGFDLFRYL